MLVIFISMIQIAGGEMQKAALDKFKKSFPEVFLIENPVNKNASQSSLYGNSKQNNIHLARVPLTNRQSAFLFKIQLNTSRALIPKVSRSRYYSGITSQDFLLGYLQCYRSSRKIPGIFFSNPILMN